MAAVLGIDTATDELTVALVRDGEPVAEREAGTDEHGRPRHSTALLGAIEEVVEEGGGWDRIDRLAVGVGPGTFTGLRIGVSTARALAQARGIPLAGVSSLAALAAGVEDQERPRLAVLDAKRREAFAALYDASGGVLWAPWVGPPAELAARVRDAPSPPLAVGGGSVRFRDELEAAGAVIPPDSDPLHRLRARHVCRLAVAAPEDAEIEPNYLRRPDAELWRERDHQPRGA